MPPLCSMLSNIQIEEEVEYYGHGGGGQSQSLVQHKDHLMVTPVFEGKDDHQQFIQLHPLYNKNLFFLLLEKRKIVRNK